MLVFGWKHHLLFWRPLHISHKRLEYSFVSLILVTCLTFYLASIGHYSHTIQMVEWPPHAFSWQSSFRHCAYKSLYSIELLEFSLPNYNWNVLWAHSWMFPANKMKSFTFITRFTDLFLFNDDTFLCFLVVSNSFDGHWW